MLETQSKSRRQTRIALIVPSSNTVMENDLHQHLPKSLYSVHTDRMYLVNTTRKDEIAMIEEYAPSAAADLGTVLPDLLVFGCTSGGSLFGLDYDVQVCKGLGEKANCEVMGVVSAAAAALERRGLKRIAVITPYIDDLTDSVAKALEAPEREVVAAYGMGISVNVQLADPLPEEIAAFAAEKLANHSFDCVFISCTNFRGMEAALLLEQAFGCPVLTSNSVIVEAIRLKVEGADYANRLAA